MADVGPKITMAVTVAVAPADEAEVLITSVQKSRRVVGHVRSRDDHATPGQTKTRIAALVQYLCADSERLALANAFLDPFGLLLVPEPIPAESLS